MKISREVKTAILVLSGIALFIYLFSFLMGEDIFENSQTYYTEFEYNALSSASPVTIKGNKIGKIEDIIYDFETGKTRVSFSVNPKLKFSKNSKIRLYQTGLMGGNALAIIDANDGELAKPGDFIASEVKPGIVSALEKDFSKVSNDLDSTIRSADTLMTNLNALVIDESEEGLKKTIAELNSTLKSFKNLSYSIQGVIKDNDERIASVLENFEKTSKDLSELSAELKEVDLTKTVENLNKTLTGIQGVMASIDNNEGTLGKLLNDDGLYNNLEAASKEMQLLLLDIKLHPARYRRILSKREIPYEEPTEEQLNNN
ncbi:MULTISPECIES: MlaD family protein [Winogradskyella]|uniref:MCE family protein n=1 Tax=Winogradskyella ouciana TaxID=2608631 RepID=A0A7K1GD45_9FLAO|nr:MULTISPECIES: MlaD family protein [Winogradskyella]MBO6881031.1 MCE family protein [Winogradskyella sp.]MTE25769.1 MCE family protein [Winogradskyella ouciana]